MKTALLVATTVCATWWAAHATVALACDKLGLIHIGGQVFRCEVKR